MWFYIFTIIIIVILLYYYFNYKQIYSENNKKKYPFLRTKIWKNVVNNYGQKRAEEIFPKTYIMPDDTNAFLKDENINKEYIVKTLFSGSRKGVFLYNPNMRNNINNYSVIQEYIENPLLINGFKFDTRLFMIYDVNNGFFLYKDGYNVYTKDRFNYKSNRRSKKLIKLMQVINIIIFINYQKQQKSYFYIIFLMIKYVMKYHYN